MSTADAWSAELESAGQVVFPQRRKRLWIRAAIVAVFFGNSLWSLIDHIRADDMSGMIAVLRITSLGAFVYLVGATVWQLATRRPMVTVDRTGIRVSKRRSYDWQQIARIDAPSGVFGPRGTLSLRSVQIQPVDQHRSTALGITHDNVLELDQLSTWLRTLHAKQTQPTDD
ncbi:hypothetical protein [Streptomyces sp. SID13031]|uniref:hypothetical protein n=1 Tax=Streptomyces sp. SID13031 TaxID=2706046 RepID=UPI0013CAC625|nr:hypothetical protein [Streptomyces sp. SID13031]NEA32112.1 hypothetical protein [Streptomyces sp. SID13031]